MAVTARSRPTHYQALGIEPGASEEAIRRAFARAMSVPRPMLEAAEVGAAYEVLRNPAKRRAYDESLGIEAAPKPPRPLPAAVSFAGTARFNAIAPAAKPAPTPAPPEPAPFIAAPPRAAVPIPEPLVHAMAEVAMAEEQPRAEAGRFGLNRTAAAVGGLVVAVALIGAWAGSEAGDAEEPQPPARAVRVALPPAKPSAEVPATSAPVAAITERRIAHAQPPRRAARSPDRLAEVGAALASADAPPPAVDEAPAAASDAAAAPAPQSSLVETAAASLPLSNATIARTIERIGYSCGKVASTSAGDAPGVYTVSCTSGQSYQAKPVHGRYRFRRLH